MSTVSSTEAKNRLNALLAEVERTGHEVTITNHGRAVARLVPIAVADRTFGQLPQLVIPDGFDDPLPDADLDAWDSTDG